MRTQVILSAALLVATLTGCQNVEQPPVLTDQDRIDSNAWLVNGYLHDQIHAGIIRQGTLFPYHFESGAASLNALGQRDMGVLCDHFRKHPAPGSDKLNVRRGDADDALYLARVATITEQLDAAGIPAEQIELTNTHAGGNGHASDHVIVILDQDNKQQPYYPSY